MNFWDTFFNEAICVDYFWKSLKGGYWDTEIFGTIVGLMNTIAGFLVTYSAKKIEFHSVQS